MRRDSDCKMARPAPLTGRSSGTHETLFNSPSHNRCSPSAGCLCKRAGECAIVSAGRDDAS